MSWKKSLVRLGLRLIGWRCEGRPPEVERCVMVAFPHTSNWDLVFLFCYGILCDVPLCFAIKQSAMRGWLGRFLTYMGGIPIDRSQHHSQVHQLASAIQSRPRILLCVTPEGTRKRASYWKTGFYVTALEAGVPLFLAFVDGQRKAFGTGPLVVPSGDIYADMKKIRDFYGDIRGIYPDQTSPIEVKPGLKVPFDQNPPPG